MLPHVSAPKALPLKIYFEYKRKTIEIETDSSLSFFISCFCFDEIIYLGAKGEQCSASSWYCRKLPTGNFSGIVYTIRQFVKTFSLAKSFHTFKNALPRIRYFAHCGERPKALPLETASFL